MGGGGVGGAYEGDGGGVGGVCAGGGVGGRVMEIGGSHIKYVDSVGEDERILWVKMRVV